MGCRKEQLSSKGTNGDSSSNEKRGSDSLRACRPTPEVLVSVSMEGPGLRAHTFTRYREQLLCVSDLSADARYLALVKC